MRFHIMAFQPDRGWSEINNPDADHGLWEGSNTHNAAKSFYNKYPDMQTDEVLVIETKDFKVIKRK